MLAHPTLASGPETDARPEDLVGLTAELYAFVHSTERLGSIRRRSRTQLDRYRARARELSERFAKAKHFQNARHRLQDARQRLGAETVLAFERAGEDLDRLVRVLGQARPHLPEVRRRWQAVGHSYEALVADIRRRRWRIPEGLTLGHVKPRNLNRNLFHVLNGVVCVAVYEVLESRWQVLAAGGAVLAGFVALDVVRRVSPTWNERLVQRWFSKIVRPHEAHRIPSATWFLAGLLAGVVVLPQHAIELGALALAFGDPAASLTGKKWGRLKLRGEKSLAGSLGFVAAATAAGVVLLSLVRPELALLARFGIAAGVAVVGALAELFTGKLDDNLTVPLLAGGAAALLLAL